VIQFIHWDSRAPSRYFAY